MALTKVTYVDQETVIGADNLNDIQDAIIDLEETTISLNATDDGDGNVVITLSTSE